tara:strand:- start:3719 stop:6130 length:2412 start_codon:yes stop_codon:yes gene_type:complete
MSDKTFPKQKVSFKSKGIKWRKSHLDWADNNSILNSSSVRAKLRTKVINQNLYNGIIDMTDLQLVLNPGEMEQYYVPKKIQHYPIITPRVNVLVGEEKRRKFDWTAVLTNPDTLSSIKDNKKQMINAKLQEMLAETGLEEEDIEKTLSEYVDYVNMDYQDIREKRANLLIRHYVGSLDMKIKFQQGFKDALIGAEEAYMFDIVNGEVTFEKLNTHKVFTLRSGSSNKFEDADVIVIDDFWSPGKIQDHYYTDLKPADIDSLERNSNATGTIDSDGMSMQIDDAAGYDLLRRESINSFLDSTGVFWDSGSNGGKSSYYDTEGNVRVLRILWRSKKCILKVSFFDEMSGEEKIKYMSEEYEINKDMGETSEKFWIDQWWKGAKIGKDIYVQIKPREIQYNKLNQPSFNSSGVVGQIYNTNDATAVSFVDRAKPFQYLYDISWYRVNEALSKYLGSIVELDIAKVPKGWTITKWLYFARKSGISVVDSFKEGQSGQAKGKLAGSVGNTTGKVLEQRVGDFIQTHIQMMDFAKAQMDEITGVSRQRLGQTENRETVGGIERAVSQSNHITEELFTLHDYCKKRCFQILLETAKIALKGNEAKFGYIADDGTRQLMEIGGDEFAEEEYGIEVSNEDSINQLQQRVDGMVQMGLQNQMLSFSTAMKIYNSPSIREVQRFIEKDETSMKQNAASSQEEQGKQFKAEQERLIAQENLDRTVNEKQFAREDETKRYIAELKAETDRINKDQEESGLETIEDSPSDIAKFEREMGIKNKSLDQDMQKHNDNMSRKDREIAIKNKVANKPSKTK